MERRRRRATGVAGFEALRFTPAAYIEQKLGWTPWAGNAEQPGQVEVIDAYTLALRQQHERADYEAGKIAEADLKYWRPGETIRNFIRVEAGHTVGKTKLASGLVNHFFDCFEPSIIYTFAPTWLQIHDLLWKEIKADRAGRNLPGRVLDIELVRSANHFAKGKATSDAGGRGSERVHGQHGRYLMFVLDEAEGIADFVWEAVDSMTSGGIVIVLMLANPRTRASKFHKAAALPNVASFRISCLWHPNVVAGKEIVPGAVRRDYVDLMLAKHAKMTESDDPDNHTLSVPWRPGVLYRPDPEFLWRVLGVSPANVTDDTFVPVGRYEAAKARPPAAETSPVARMGVDVARYGKDFGTLYVCRGQQVWRAAQFYQQNTLEYSQAIKAEALALAAQGVTSLHIRVDGGGGFGGGVIDDLAADQDLVNAFDDFVVLEVYFNGRAYSVEAYADCVTEMYATAGERLKVLALVDAPDALEADVCERAYRWVTSQGVAVKKLEPKEDFRKRQKRSPDDGDGFVLAAAPDYVFLPRVDEAETLVVDDSVSISPY